MDAVSFCFLLFIHHIAHQHLERLHGHIDARVEQHEHDEAEEHHRRDGKSQRAGIRQQAHHGHSNGCSNKQIRYTTAEAAPGLVGECADDGLHDHTHERR